MLVFLKQIIKNTPTFLLAFALAMAVWVSAVSASDPTQQKVYPDTVPLEVIGLDPGMMVISDIPGQVILTLSAPQSIWNRLENEIEPISALIDLSGYDTGVHMIPVQIGIRVNPVRIVSYSPEEVEIELEKLESRSLPVNLARTGEPAIGFEAEEAILDVKTAEISGSSSLVGKVKEVRASLDINRANENIERKVKLQVFDGDGFEIKGVSVNPEEVLIVQNISQLGGYRNVVVKGGCLRPGR